uniref:Uncharacterized protein n=1 Tax=Geospiza parvula TaxID=87175 RepID=A0A8C3N661_GEOPR
LMPCALNYPQPQPPLLHSTIPMCSPATLPHPPKHMSPPRAVSSRIPPAQPQPALTELAVAVAAPAQPLQVPLQHVGEQVAGRDLHGVPAEGLADLRHRHPQQPAGVGLAHPAGAGRRGSSHAPPATAAIAAAILAPPRPRQAAPLQRRAHRAGRSAGSAPGAPPGRVPLLRGHAGKGKCINIGTSLGPGEGKYINISTSLRSGEGKWINIGTSVPVNVPQCPKGSHRKDATRLFPRAGRDRTRGMLSS